MIAQHHRDMLTASGITPEHATARGYETITDKRRLAEVGIVKPGRTTPGLLIPQLRPDGSTWGWQYRPDTPRLREGKPVKYETPWQQRNGLDIPPGVADRLGDPAIPLWITEGVKKADCGALNGLCIVALSGTWNWLCTNTVGGKVALPDWRDIALNGRRVIVAFDGDVARKPLVQKASHALAGYLAYKGAHVEYLWLPDDDEKIGLDDYLESHTVEDLWRLVKPAQPSPKTETSSDRGEYRRAGRPIPEPVLRTDAEQAEALEDTHHTFRKWLGDKYDADALDATLAAVAAQQMDGDPLWLLVISGSGNAKTETVQSISDVPFVHVTSTITSEGALLSATAERDKAKDAHGGLLRHTSHPQRPSPQGPHLKPTRGARRDSDPDVAGDHRRPAGLVGDTQTEDRHRLQRNTVGRWHQRRPADVVLVAGVRQQCDDRLQRSGARPVRNRVRGRLSHGVDE